MERRLSNFYHVGFLIKSKKKCQKESALEDKKERTERTMKKQCIRCLAAVSLIVTIGTGAGTVLNLMKRKWLEKPGGGDL